MWYFKKTQTVINETLIRDSAHIKEINYSVHLIMYEINKMCMK